MTFGAASRSWADRKLSLIGPLDQQPLNMNEGDMDDFVANPSRWRIALLVLGSVAFVAIGAWMAGMFGSAPTSRRYPAVLIVTIGWFVIVFFGLSAAYWMRGLFKSSDELRINEYGIRWTRWSDRAIPWSQIENIGEWGYKGERDIVLHLHSPELFPGRGVLGRMAKANRRLCGGDIAISLTGTDRTFHEAMAAIARFRQLNRPLNDGG